MPEINGISVPFVPIGDYNGNNPRIKSPGDIAKAFGGGADFVMLGGMLAGHLESGGELIENENGKKYSIHFTGIEIFIKRYEIDIYAIQNKFNSH